MRRSSTRLRPIATSANAELYRRPHSVMPPHGAPLGMLYYHGDKFAELKDKLLVSLHGYRPTGSRVLVYDTDPHGLPKVAPAPVRYNVSCAASEVFSENRKPIAASPYVELISGWHKVTGVRPQGTPVGLAVASDGAIWLAEDKNQTIIRIDAEPRSAAVGPLPCANRTPAQISAIVNQVMKDAANRKRLSEVRAGLIERHCAGCHAGFDIKPGMSEAPEKRPCCGSCWRRKAGSCRAIPRAGWRGSGLGARRRENDAGGRSRTDRERTGLQGVVEDARRVRGENSGALTKQGMR